MSTLGYMLRYALARLTFDWIRDASRARRRRAAAAEAGRRRAPAPRPPRPRAPDPSVLFADPPVRACEAEACAWNLGRTCTRPHVYVDAGGGCADYAPRDTPAGSSRP